MSANFTPEKEDLKILTPFKMQVLTNFPYIEADFDALTNYQLLCKVVEYLNNTITEMNEVTEQTLSLYNAFISLQNYVNTYFDNLDLQSEVDTKLDEMAEDGTLADMIAEYIKMQGLLVYSTVNDMKIAENIQNGSFLKTYGYHTINDNGGAFYKAREVTNADVIDNAFIIALHDENLVAELIVNDYISPEMLGAYGDGVADDTIPLHKAIEYSDIHYIPTITVKKYYITSSLNVENLTNGFININGLIPQHNYSRQGQSEYGYNIGGSLILNDITLLSGDNTKFIRGTIKNVTCITKSKNYSSDLFYKVRFNGFKFNELSIFYFRYVFNTCLTTASSYLSNSVIQYIDKLITGSEGFIESAIDNNYISGNANRESICFDSTLSGTKITNNFIEGFDCIFNNTTSNRILADYFSSRNTYDAFGVLFGKKANNDNLIYVGFISVEDQFSNWKGTSAIDIGGYNFHITIKSPYVKPNTNLSNKFLTSNANLYVQPTDYLYIDSISKNLNSNTATIEVNFSTSTRYGKHVYIEDYEYIEVESLPTASYIGHHVIYNGELYCYIASQTWKQLSNATV